MPDRDPAEDEATAPAPRLIYVRGYGYVALPRYFWPVVWAVAAVLLLPPLGLAVFLQVFDADGYRPRIAESLTRAVGRSVEIGGKVRLSGVLTPRLSFGPVAVLGAAGGSRRELARVERVEVELGLWPLLRGRVEIRRVGLDGPDILLERDARGQGNWQAGGVAAPLADRAAVLGLQAVSVRDGRLVWRDDGRGSTLSLNLKRVTLTTGPEGNLALNTEVTLGRDRVVLNGEGGTLARLLEPGGETPWPVSLSLQARGGNLTAKGSFAAPLRVSGYQLQVDGDVRESQNFRALLPEGWPALRNVHLSVRLSDRGGSVPDLTALALTVGASDVSGLLPGGRLERLELRAGGMNEALHGEVKGVVGGAPLQLAAVLGTPGGMMQAAARLGWLPGWLAPAAAVGFPIEISAVLGDSEFAASGAMGDPARLSGVELSTNATLRDLEKLEPVLGRRLPVWAFADLQAQLRDAGGSVLDGLTVASFSLSTPDGDIGGAGQVRFGAMPEVTGTVQGARLDWDRLGVSLAALHFGAPPPLVTKAPPGARVATRVLHERPLALGGFSLARLNLAAHWDVVQLFGLPYRDVRGQVRLRDGALVLDGFGGQSPGGAVAAQFSYDTGAEAAPMRLHLAAPALAIKPVLIALQRPEDITGNLAVAVDLAAEGRDLHALAGSLRGRAGLALVDGEIDTRLFTPYMFGMLRAARMPMHLLSVGLSRTRCFAVALAAERGEVRLETLLLDSARLMIAASGRVSGDSEAVDLRIRPQLRFDGPALTVPMRVMGSLSGTRLLVDNAAESADVPKAFLANALAVERGADGCPAALTAARGGAAGPLPREAPFAVTTMPTPRLENDE